MADPIDSFQKLEEKLGRAIELFKKTQTDKRVLLRELEMLKADGKERAKRLDTLERELHALRREREDVRERIENLIERIEVLTTPDSAG